jgi:hypothetical protein
MTSYVHAPRDASHPMHQPRPNRFGGACGSCGAGVKVGQGTVMDTGNRRVVLHLAGQCPERPATAKLAARPNRYAGDCGTCGGHVAAGLGRVDKVNGRWVVFHVGEASCTPEAKAARRPVPARPARPEGDQPAWPANLYPGSCADCGEWVEADAGRRFQPPGGGRWQVAHQPGGCPPPLPEGVDDGYYATRSATGNNDLDFWRVSRNDAGRIKVQRVIGGHADTPVNRTVGHAALTAILAEGPEACATRYGVESESCCHCNHHLTEQASRELGYGPDCAEDHGNGETWQALDKQRKAEAAAAHDARELATV